MTTATSPAKVGDTWYRYEDHRYASLTEWDEISSVSVQVDEQTYKVAKVTPKGVWLSIGFGDRRFVLLDARKRFAHPTKEEALQSLKARKEAQMRILRTRLGYAERAVNLVDRELAKLSNTPLSAELEILTA